MKTNKLLCILTVVALLGISGCHEENNGTIPGVFSPAPENDTLFQASTLGALMMGVYDGDMSFADLKSHGGFGLGTLNRLDGEMIALEGKFYHVRADGCAYQVADTRKTPFAMITSFEPDDSFLVEGPLDYEGLKKAVDDRLPTENLIYAVRVKGRFEYLKTRSIPDQQKPYPPLAEVLEKQLEFEFDNIEGTMAGFRMPAFFRDINAPGYHFHFLNEQCTAGGHVLALRVRQVKVEIDYTDRFLMEFPGTGDFYNYEFNE